MYWYKYVIKQIINFNSMVTVTNTFMDSCWKVYWMPNFSGWKDVYWSRKFNPLSFLWQDHLKLKNPCMKEKEVSPLSWKGREYWGNHWNPLMTPLYVAITHQCKGGTYQRWFLPHGRSIDSSQLTAPQRH